MKMIGLLIFSMIAASFSAGARTAECGNSAFSSRAIFEFPGAGYWMQASGDCRITYTSWGGFNSQMYNICKRKLEKFTDDIDPYPVPGIPGEEGGDLYVHPHQGLQFWSTKEVLKDASKARPIFTDTEHLGVYESVGILPSSRKGNRTIRVAVGNTTGRIRDYTIENRNDSYKITPVQSEPVSVCTNLPNSGLDFETPVLSRDGQMISNRNIVDRSTVIYRIKMPSGNCEPIFKIKSETSKVSFSFDNKSVFYIIQDPNTFKGRLMETEIATGKTQTVSAPVEDVQFMTNRYDGSLFYSRRSDVAGKFELIQMSPGSLTHGHDDSKLFEAIGMMWGVACGESLDLSSALAVGKRLNKKACETVLTDANLQAIGSKLIKSEMSRMRNVCGANLEAHSTTSEGSH